VLTPGMGPARRLDFPKDLCGDDGFVRPSATTCRGWANETKGQGKDLSGHRKRAMNVKPTDVHSHEETAAHPRYAPSPKRMRRRDSFEHRDERLHALRDALRAAKQGDFSVRLPTDGAAEGVMGEVALAFNAFIEQNDALVNELRRVDRSVGFEGKTTDRASLAAGGSWAVAVDSVNSLVEKMDWPVSEATSVLGLVANGDLSRDMSLHMDGTALEGDFRELGTTVKTVVGRLRKVSSGVSRVVREMGTEGKLGGQASLESLSGTWKDHRGTRRDNSGRKPTWSRIDVHHRSSQGSHH